MRNPDEILLWLVKNCEYNIDHKNIGEIQKILNENDDYISLYVSVNYVPALISPLNSFESWVGTTYDPKILQPLIENKSISIIGNGLVKNYKTKEIFIRFWFGENPNERLTNAP